MGSPAQFAHLANFTAALRKPGLIPFWTFNPQDAAWLQVIVDMPGGGGGGSGNLTQASVSFNSNLTIDASLAQVISITLSGNVLSSVINYQGGPSVPLGRTLELRIIEGGGGGFTFALPANVILEPGFVIDTTAGRATVLPLFWNGSAWLTYAPAYSVPQP